MRLSCIRPLLVLALLLGLVGSLPPSEARGQAAVEAVGPAPTDLNKDKPFKALAAAPAKVAAGESFQVRATVHLVNKIHYLYKESMSLKLEAAPGFTPGAVSFSPPAEQKLDPFENRMMDVYHVPVTLSLEVKVDPGATLGAHTLPVAVAYRGCNPTVCFFPTTENFPLSVEVVAPGTLPAEAGVQDAVEPPAEASPAPAAGTASNPGPASDSAPPSSVGGESDTFNNAMQRGLLWTFLVVFGLGILASFSPCVYPIIPITLSVLGARQTRSKLHGFSLALVYVLGLAVVYTILGVVAATSGKLFGSTFQNPWVIGSVAVLFIAMGFSTLGAFSVTLPSGLATRLSQVQGSGYTGAFVTGAVAGLVASPCVGPLIVSLLTYIARTGDILLGSALMFTFAFGMGQLFLLLGTFAISLPRSGAWMDTIKGLMAALLFGAGLYYLQFVVPHGYYQVLLGLAGLVGAVFVGAFDPLTAEATTGDRFKKAAGLILLVAGLVAFVLGLLLTMAPDLASALQQRGEKTETVAKAGIAWETTYAQGLAKAKSENRPMILDFRADWCVDCKKLEHFTYTDAKVIDAVKAVVPVMMDDKAPEFEGLRQRFKVAGLPTVLFISPDGEPDPSLTITGFVEAREFLRRLCALKGLRVAELNNVCPA